MLRVVGSFAHDAAARALYENTLGWIMSDAQYNLDRLNVLVLDDNRNMRTLIQSILFALGVREFHEAPDVKQAFRDLQYFRADAEHCAEAGWRVIATCRDLTHGHETGQYQGPLVCGA